MVLSGALTSFKENRVDYADARTAPAATGHVYVQPVAPVAYQVILELGISQFRDFEPPRVHTRTNPWGLFLVHKLTCGKRESVS